MLVMHLFLKKIFKFIYDRYIIFINKMIYKTILLIAFPIFGYYYYLRKHKTKHNLTDFFKNKNIIITGASQGIGKQLSIVLSKYNCKLFLLARGFKTRTDKQTFYYKCDCSKYDDVSLVMKSIAKTCDDSPHILINCAGSGDWKFVTEMSSKEIIDCIKAPLLASIFTTKEFLNYINPLLTGKNNFQIIFIQSPASIQPWKSSTIYSASRWGMHGFAEALKADYYGKNLSIKEVILGKVNSNYFINNPTANKRFPLISRFIPETSLEDASNIIVNSLVSDCDTVIHPPIIKIMKYTYQYFPLVIQSLIYKLGYSQ